MKKIIFCLAFCACVFQSTDSNAFGRRNHAAVAYIAEQHLTPAARRAVGQIYNGLSLAEYGCYPDDHRLSILVPLDEGEYITVDGKPVLKGPDGKPFSYGTNFFTREDGSVWTTVAHGWLADGDFNVVSVAKGECVWAINKYVGELRSWKTNSAEENLLALQMLVHEVGDMHCPSHVHFTDARDRNDLKFDVIYRGKSVRFHSIWDTDILVDRYPGGMTDMAIYADPMLNGSLSRRDAGKYMKGIQAGSVEDWARDVARRCNVTFAVQPGDKLTTEQIDEFSALGRDMVLFAGYRLASLLNEIFK